MNKHDLIQEADKRGLIADGLNIRNELIEKLHSNELSLDEVQAQLKSLKKSAKKNNLYVLADFHKKNSTITLEHITKKEVENRYNNLSNTIKNKTNTQKKLKI